MNTAWVSGLTGCAIVAQSLEDEVVYLRLDAGRSTSPVPCSVGHLRHLLTTAPDLEMIEDLGPAPLDVARAALDGAWRQDRALALGLTAVDVNMPERLRAKAAAQADRLLADKRTLNTVRNRLLGTQLPEVADLSKLPSGTTLSGLFAEAQAARDLVRLVQRAWRAAYRVVSSLEVALDVDFLAKVVEPACVMRGGYAALVDATRAGSRTAFHDWLREHDDSPFDQPGVTTFLRAWCEEAFRLTHKDKGLDECFQEWLASEDCRVAIDLNMLCRQQDMPARPLYSALFHAIPRNADVKSTLAQLATSLLTKINIESMSVESENLLHRLLDLLAELKRLLPQFKDTTSSNVMIHQLVDVESRYRSRSMLDRADTAMNIRLFLLVRQTGLGRQFAVRHDLLQNRQVHLSRVSR